MCIISVRLSLLGKQSSNLKEKKDSQLILESKVLLKTTALYHCSMVDFLKSYRHILWRENYLNYFLKLL